MLAEVNQGILSHLMHFLTKKTGNLLNGNTVNKFYTKFYIRFFNLVVQI